MSRHTVTTSVQNLFPDGNQPATVIVNEGPYTIYVGQDTSLSRYNGMAIPPNGRTVWNARTPLFVVSRDGTSTVDVTRNNVMPDIQISNLAKRLFGTTDHPVGEPITVETGTYETITIRLDMK